MSSVPAVGIDLGTTYSSIAWLNEQSEPVTIPNLEGESSTPSVVMCLEGREVVGRRRWTIPSFIPTGSSTGRSGLWEPTGRPGRSTGGRSPRWTWRRRLCGNC
ncbi:MAG: Hsp70 family protein [Planctomycetaceae bacterium]